MKKGLSTRCTFMFAEGNKKVKILRLIDERKNQQLQIEDQLDATLELVLRNDVSTLAMMVVEAFCHFLHQAIAKVQKRSK